MRFVWSDQSNSADFPLIEICNRKDAKATSAILGPRVELDAFAATLEVQDAVADKHPVRRGVNDQKRSMPRNVAEDKRTWCTQ